MKKFKLIYLNSAIGLGTNALLDIPLILLFSKIGIPAYIATVIATCIGYTISITIVLIYLRKNMNFKYRRVLDNTLKLIIPLIIILVPIALSKHFITFEYTRLNSFISLIIHGFFGVIVYLLLVYKNGVLQNVFGEDFVDNVLKKLHIKK